MASKSTTAKSAPKNAKKKTTKVSSTKANKELTALKDELAAEKEKFVRLFAEFENYKKRTAKERLDLFKTAGQDVLSALIPVLDDFDRATQLWTDKEPPQEVAGLLLIHNKLKAVVERNGLQETTTEIGAAFDAELQEAISLIPVPTPEQKGAIIDVVEKGYQLGDKIIRFPKVVVGQ
jgi:molecular chaperone GrpE